MRDQARGELRRAARLLPDGRAEAANAAWCVRTAGMPADLVLGLLRRGVAPAMLVRFLTGPPGHLHATENALRLAAVVCDAGANRGDGRHPAVQNTATVLDAAIAADQAGLPGPVLHAWITSRMLLPRWDPHRVDEWNPPGLPAATLRAWTAPANNLDRWIPSGKSLADPPPLNPDGLRAWLPAGVDAPDYYFAGYSPRRAAELCALPCGHPDRPGPGDLAVQAALLAAR